MGSSYRRVRLAPLLIGRRPMWYPREPQSENTLLAAIAGGRVDAQSRNRPPPQYKTWGEPDQAKGFEILQGFLLQGFPLFSGR